MFNPLAEKVVRKLTVGERVVEFGNQRYWGPDHPSTEAFYKSLGWKEYVAIDVNERMGAIALDLNSESASEEIDGHFDLVTNNGTGEHIFNQHAVFANAHNMCRVGGTMLHILPMTTWLNHGFYNYNPILFRDLGYANGYDHFKKGVFTRDGVGTWIKEDWFFLEKKPDQLYATVGAIMQKTSKDVFMVSCFKKVEDTKFRMPLQGKYQQDVENDVIKSEYIAERA